MSEIDPTDGMNNPQSPGTAWECPKCKQLFNVAAAKEHLGACPFCQDKPLHYKIIDGEERV